MDNKNKYTLAAIIGILALAFFILSVGIRSNAGLTGPGALTTFVVIGSYFAIKSLFKSDNNSDEDSNKQD